MKLILRPIFILIVLILLIVILSGCTDNKEIETETMTSNIIESAATEEGACVVMEGTGPSWTWDTSPIELDWFIDRYTYDRRWDSENRWLDKWIKEKTGITNINIITPQGNRYDKFYIMLSAGQLPDAVTIDMLLYTDKLGTRYKMLMESGLIYPFDELAAKYAPDFRQQLSETMINWFRYDDGNFYGLVSNFKSPERFDERIMIEDSFKIVARKDIAESLGINLEDFMYQDTFIQALKKVKAANLKGPDGQEMTTIMSTEFMLYDGSLPMYAQCFGISEEDNEGNYIPKQKHPAFLEMLRFLNRLYREGILNKNDFHAFYSKPGVDDMIEKAASNGSVFMLIGKYSRYRSEFMEANEKYGAYMTAVGPVRSMESREPYFGVPMTGGGWTSTMIPKSSRYPDRMVRLLGLLYSDEGQLAEEFGEEGLHYEIRADDLGLKRVFWTSEFEEYRRNNDDMTIRKEIGLNTLWVAIDQNFISAWKPTELDTYNGKMDFDIRMSNKDYYYDNTYYTSHLMFPPPKSEEEKIRSDVSSIISRRIIDMLTAGTEEQLDIIYKETMKECDEAGWDRLIKYKNEKLQKLKSGMAFVLSDSEVN